VPEANAFAFSDIHVLYGKLRRYLNKVYLPPFSGKCSTELIPLRPNKRIQRAYLAFFLRAPATAEKISQRVAGARMPRAEMSFVMSLPIPLPPVKVQRHIVDMLSRVGGVLTHLQ
jgi:type I restriction enzyme S subunit